MDLYTKETRENPSFSMIKNVFDYIDIRKDGKIDFKEWCKTFAYQEVINSLSLSPNWKNIQINLRLRV